MPRSKSPLLKKRLASREGRPYIPSVLDEADIGRIKDFYGSLGYPRAEVALETPKAPRGGAGTVALVLKVVPHERIRILISGAKVPESLVRPIWEERVFEEWGLLQSEARVISYLRNQGYVFATAKSSLEKDGGEIRIVHEVNPGRKYTIYDVDFEGLRFFTPGGAQKETRTRPQPALFGGIGGEKLFEMPARIERLYETEGFPETRVDLNFRKSATTCGRSIISKKAPSMTIGRLTLSRRSSVRLQSTLRDSVRARKAGRSYEPDHPEDIERLETFYLNQGVRGTTVTAAVDPTAADRFEVAFDIKEGRRVKIERIVVTGNQRHPAGARSTASSRSGQGDAALTPTGSRRPDASLEKLGHLCRSARSRRSRFRRMPRTSSSTSARARAITSAWASGLETKTEPAELRDLDQRLRPRGTAELILGNMFGRASQLSFVTQFSLKETRAVVSWEDRYLFGLPRPDVAQRLDRARRAGELRLRPAGRQLHRDQAASAEDWVSSRRCAGRARRSIFSMSRSPRSTGSIIPFPRPRSRKA